MSPPLYFRELDAVVVKDSHEEVEVRGDNDTLVFYPMGEGDWTEEGSLVCTKCREWQEAAAPVVEISTRVIQRGKTAWGYAHVHCPQCRRRRVSRIASHIPRIFGKEVAKEKEEIQTPST